MSKLIKSYLEADGKNCYEGYYIDDYNWNGFKAPYFTKEVSDKIVSDVNKDNEEFLELFYDQEKNCYKCIDKQLIDEDNPQQNKDEYISEYDAQVFIIDNKEVTLYGIGACEWTWSICDPDEHKQIKL